MSWRDRNAKAKWSAWPRFLPMRPATTEGTMSKTKLSKSRFGPPALGALIVASSIEVRPKRNRGSSMSARAPGL